MQHSSNTFLWPWLIVVGHFIWCCYIIHFHPIISHSVLQYPILSYISSYTVPFHHTMSPFILHCPFPPNNVPSHPTFSFSSYTVPFHHTLSPSILHSPTILHCPFHPTMSHPTLHSPFHHTITPPSYTVLLHPTISHPTLHFPFHLTISPSILCPLPPYVLIHYKISTSIQHCPFPPQNTPFLP